METSSFIEMVIDKSNFIPPLCVRLDPSPPLASPHQLALPRIASLPRLARGIWFLAVACLAYTWIGGGADRCSGQATDLTVKEHNSAVVEFDSTVAQPDSATTRSDSTATDSNRWPQTRFSGGRPRFDGGRLDSTSKLSLPTHESGISSPTRARKSLPSWASFLGKARSKLATKRQALTGKTRRAVSEGSKRTLS